MQRIVRPVLLTMLTLVAVMSVGTALTNAWASTDDIIFTLVNAATDQDIYELGDEATINLAEAGQELNIRADFAVPADHVRFELDGVDFRTEKSAPYALAGDDAGDYRSWIPLVGQHTLQATAYDSTGNEVTSKIVYFTIADNATDADNIEKSASNEEVVVSPSSASDWKKTVYAGDTNYIKFEFPQGRGLQDLESFELDIDVNRSPDCYMEILPHSGVSPLKIENAGNQKIPFESFGKALNYFHDSFTNSISFKFRLKSNSSIGGVFVEITNANLKLFYKNDDPAPPSPDSTPIAVSPSSTTDWKKTVNAGDTNYIKFEFPQGRGLQDLENFELDLDVNKSAYCSMEITPHSGVNSPFTILYAGNQKIPFGSFDASLSSFHDSFTDSISFKFQLKTNTPIDGAFVEITDATLTLFYKQNDDDDPDPPSPQPSPPSPDPTPHSQCDSIEVSGFDVQDHINGTYTRSNHNQTVWESNTHTIQFGGVSPDYWEIWAKPPGGDPYPYPGRWALCDPGDNPGNGPFSCNDWREWRGSGWGYRLSVPATFTCLD